MSSEGRAGLFFFGVMMLWAYGFGMLLSGQWNF